MEWLDSELVDRRVAVTDDSKAAPRDVLMDEKMADYWASSKAAYWGFLKVVKMVELKVGL